MGGMEILLLNAPLYHHQPSVISSVHSSLIVINPFSSHQHPHHFIDRTTILIWIQFVMWFLIILLNYTFCYLCAKQGLNGIMKNNNQRKRGGRRKLKVFEEIYNNDDVDGQSWYENKVKSVGIIPRQGSTSVSRQIHTTSNFQPFTPEYNLATGCVNATKKVFKFKC